MLKIFTNMHLKIGKLFWRNAKLPPPGKISRYGPACKHVPMSSLRNYLSVLWRVIVIIVIVALQYSAIHGSNTFVYSNGSPTYYIMYHSLKCYPTYLLYLKVHSIVVFIWVWVEALMKFVVFTTF